MQTLPKQCNVLPSVVQMTTKDQNEFYIHRRLSRLEMNILKLLGVFRNCSSYNFFIDVICNVISQGAGISTSIWARKKSVWKVLLAEKRNQPSQDKLSWQLSVCESQETWSPQRHLHPNSSTFVCGRLHGDRPAHIIVKDLWKIFTGNNKVGQIKSFIFLKVEVREVCRDDRVWKLRFAGFKGSEEHRPRALSSGDL